MTLVRWLKAGGPVSVRGSLCAMMLMCAGVRAAEKGAEPAADSPARAEGAAILQQLRSFASTGRVLHVGAHPDDENTQLIAYLARSRGYAAAYLSITRGDGGQNLLGAEFDEKLGVARTQELLEARKLDGGRQFFTRAIDFGFSKNPEETLRIWDHQAVLSDVVRVIRRFRPDVIVTRFPIPPGSGGHGHHTASAILAMEAFKACGDPKAFPEQLADGLTPWQPKRIFWNGFNLNSGGGLEKLPSVKVDIGGDDPVTGEALGIVAARSRGMHKTQALGDFANRGSGGPRVDTFVLLGGEPATSDLMDGIDTTWARVEGGAEIGPLVEAAVAGFKRDDAAASVPALLAIRRKLAALPRSVVVDEKRADLDRILQRCLGLEVRSVSSWQTAVPGESAPATATVRLRAAVPVTLVRIDAGRTSVPLNEALKPAGEATHEFKYPVPKSAAVTQPYWLQAPPSVGMYNVADTKLIGLPENPPDLPVTYRFAIDGQTFTVTDTLLCAASDAAEAKPLPVAVVPKVALRFASGAAVFRPGATVPVTLEVIAGRPNVTGTVELEVPEGWKTSPAQPFKIEETLKSVTVSFDVTAPAATAVGSLGAHAIVDGAAWNTDAITIKYPHIPLQLLQPAAAKKVVSVEVGTRGQNVGYVPGAGDDVAQALRQLGYRVTLLDGKAVTPDSLKGLDAVVLGVRAINTRTDLPTLLPALFAYAEQGGTVICQYNWARNLKTPDFAPYRLQLSDRRVTDENAPVQFVMPEHPLLNTPNKITPADFEGWVQERGVYFPSEWASQFTPVLAMNDPGEAPLQGSLLIAPHGKGYFVYTSLAFFRQLPAGVPGAYRLFANLVSIGK